MLYKKLLLLFIFTLVSLPVFSFSKISKNPVAIYEEINPAIVSVDHNYQMDCHAEPAALLIKAE